MYTFQKETRLLIVLTIIICLIFSNSCQRTPARSIINNSLDDIINSNKDNYNSSSNSNLNNMNGILDIPVIDHWEEKIIIDSSVKLNIDAEIYIAAPDIYPVLRVKKRVYTIEDVNKIINYFFKDNKLYKYETGFNTYVAEKEIIKLKEIIHRVKNHNEIDNNVKESAEQLLEESIIYLQNEIKINKTIKLRQKQGVPKTVRLRV